MTVRRIALLVSLVALGAPAAADAATRYASPTGSGTTCSNASPCSLAQATAPANVNPGDELVIKAGTYMDAPQIAIQDANVSIHGEVGQPRPLVVSSASTAMFANVANVSISRLRIENSAAGGGLLMFAGSGTVEDVVIHSRDGTACNLNTGTYTMRNSVCWTEGGGDAGFSTANGPATITLRNVTAVSTATVNTDGLRVTAGAGATTTVNATNVIARTAGTDGPSDDVQGTADSTAGSTTTVTLSHSNYSDVFAFAPAPGVATVTNPATNNNQTLAPVYLDAATGLFHQAASSPTVNAGITDAQNGTTDIDGEARANGTTDIGADEFFSTDGDADGIPDGPDDCEAGDTGWTSTGATDRDTDGCRDAGEDLDDDNDTMADGPDNCETGDVGWISSASTDIDGDGCRDAGEDLDDDADGDADTADNCPAVANADQTNTDGDSEGNACDTDDDNDSKVDGSDNCPAGDIGWTSNGTTDIDNDGCRDGGEDLDDDGDGALDASDSCAGGETGWTSNTSTDHDSDGCRDSTEDSDDDNDTVADNGDACPAGDTNWTSNATTDIDGDGCRDAGEDADDDGDSLADGSDNCPGSANADQVDTDGDNQGNACDSDDDNDTVADNGDACPTGDTSWTSNATTDNDGDGCRDAGGEDSDDDNDTVADGSDNCQLVPNTDQANTDGDSEGDLCDADDDNDAVADTADNCPTQAGPASNGGCPGVPRDTIAPETTIDSGPAKRVFKRQARFALSSDDATARFECSLDGKAFAPCDSTVRYRVKLGKHTFAARAVDAAGNADASPASWAWKVKRKRR